MSAARATERTVSTRSRPRKRQDRGSESASHASAISLGLAPWTSALSQKRAIGAHAPWRSGPPSGRYASSRIPCVTQCCPTPLRKPASLTGAELDLNGVDIDEPPCLLDLPDGDIAQADRSIDALPLECGKRAHAGRQRRPRVGRVQL